jgi:magnesium chelatase subunit H
MLAELWALVQERKVAVLLYGFPPGVGATGTAALLNIPKSLERMLEQLRAKGYDLGPASGQGISGEAIINALRMQEDQRSISSGAAGIEKA